jgi:hypothetical protein
MIVETKGLHVDTDTAAWRKSPKSGGYSDNCVEIAPIAGGVAVRDSKNPDGPALLYTRDEWAAFVGGVKDGEFDDM